MHAAQRQRLRNQTGPQAPATLLLAPRHRIIKIRKQGVVVPGYDSVDGAGLGAFAGMLPADQCAQRAMGAFKVTRAPSRTRRLEMPLKMPQRVARSAGLERGQWKKKAWLSYGNLAF